MNLDIEDNWNAEFHRKVGEITDNYNYDINNLHGKIYILERNLKIANHELILATIERIELLNLINIIKNELDI